MNYAFDLWDLQGSENSVGHFDYFYEAFSPNQHFFSSEHYQASQEINLPMIDEPNCMCLQASPIDEQPSTSQFEQKQFKPPLRVRKIPCHSSQKLKKKRHMKSSPYHNYQKHLNNTLKQLLSLEALSFQSPQEILVAHNLWNIFSKNQSSTKKILNFIFNEYNQYPFKENDLEEFGFKEIYSTTPSKMLAGARVYLTKIAINHLNEENIDRYLQTRRIKNPIKFKKYLMVFRKELQDGFLKKRFTNRSRKEQLRKLREKEIQTSQ